MGLGIFDLFFKCLPIKKLTWDCQNNFFTCDFSASH